MGVIIHIVILPFPDIDECTSGTDDCHSSLLVPTQSDPLVVHVMILPAEMAELAIYLQVTRKMFS